jgi:hypothetical protein
MSTNMSTKIQTLNLETKKPITRNLPKNKRKRDHIDEYMELDIVKEQTQELQEKLKSCIRLHVERGSTHDEILWMLETFLE